MGTLTYTALERPFKALLFYLDFTEFFMFVSQINRGKMCILRNYRRYNKVKPKSGKEAVWSPFDVFLCNWQNIFSFNYFKVRKWMGTTFHRNLLCCAHRQIKKYL